MSYAEFINRKSFKPISAGFEDGRVVCARCEAAAIEAGLPSSSEICGRHVCIGGVKAVSHCHPERTA